MIRSSPSIKLGKRKVLIALGILFTVLLILFFNIESIFAENKSEYQYTDGKFYMEVYIGDEKKSDYTVPCSLGEDRPGVTPNDESQSFVNYTLNLTWGDDTIDYHPWMACTSIDSVDFSLPWFTFENRQFVWHFYMKSKTYGYHLNKVTSPEGNVQASCKGSSNGDFEITSDTNGLGITTYATGYRYFNTFCVYLEPNHYTLKYDGNGATSGSVDDRACTFGEGFNVANGGFSKTGYTLTGWNTKADGTGTHYDKNQWTSNLAGDDGGTVTLYAEWTPNTYTINYNGNGATGGSIDPQTVNYGDEWTLKTGFTKTGHSLTGYAVVRASDNAIFCGDKGWQSDYGWAHPEKWTIYSAGSKWTMNEAWINSSRTTDTFTFCAQWKINSYLQKVYVRYQNADGSWGSYSPVINGNYNYGSTVSWSRAADSAYKAASISYTVTEAKTSYVDVYRQQYKQIVKVRYQKADGTWGDYSNVINANYYYGSTVSWSRAADSVYKTASISYTVTSANTKYVSVYRNSYTQTINYYYYKASGTYNSPTHTKTLLGSKSWSQLYGTTFNAKAHKADWGNVDGYHWSSIDSESWTVTCAASTNSYYSANKYRLNVDLNKGSGSSTPSGTSGNFDMEYGTYINLGTPAMTGYTFSGWSITEHNSIGHSLSANTFTMGYNKSYPNQSYTSDSTVKIKAKWNVNSYNLIYDLNDNVGSTRAQFGAYHPNTVKFDTEFTVSNPSRAGYSFAGWNITGMDNSTHYYGAHRTTEGYIDNTCETVFKNLNSSNEAVVTFKAVWLPNTYTIHFEGNGAAGGNVDDITVSYDENMTLPENGYELDRNTFVGWTHDCTAHVGAYAEDQEILSSVIIDAAGMTIQNNGIIYLYCAWDPAPNITVSDKTFSLDEARNGLITEGRLFEGAYAMDEILDSDILPGTHLLENGSCNSFTITNFSEDEFTQFTDSGSATITYQVVDSVGNITEETITVFIVDNTPKEAQSGEGTYHVRFISDKYYDKTEVEGGLPEDSIWRKRPEYVELLSEVMEK